MKIRVNISIGPALHKQAKTFAKQRETDFSSLVAEALRAFMGTNGVKASPSTIASAIELDDESAASTVSQPAIPRNRKCICGSGMKFKHCCEAVFGPEALKLPEPKGYRRLARRPRKGETCPCGSGIPWEACCMAHLPFVKVS